MSASTDYGDLESALGERHLADESGKSDDIGVYLHERGLPKADMTCVTLVFGLAASTRIVDDSRKHSHELEAH